MHDGFERRYAGRGPWEEVWFVEATTRDGRGLWLRYVITDGAHAGCAVWAIAFDGDRIVAHRDPSPLGALGEHGIFERHDGARLTPVRAIGAAGPIRWDLELRDRGRRHRLIPRTIERLRVFRHYTPAIADLELGGTLEVDGERWPVDGGRGVVGHIHGRSNRTHAWTWAHCNTFDEDALFEGLSARLQLGAVVTPPLTSLVLHHGGRRFAFDRTRDLAAIRSRFGDGRWTFAARRGPLSLEGEALLPERRAIARYTDPDGAHAWCENSRLSRLVVHVVDRETGLDLRLESRSAAFETGSRVAPDRPPDVG